MAPAITTYFEQAILAEHKMTGGISARRSYSYSVSRSDVGAFIFEELIKRQGQGEWTDRKVTLTY